MEFFTSLIDLIYSYGIVTQHVLLNEAMLRLGEKVIISKICIQISEAVSVLKNNIIKMEVEE